VTVAYTTTRDLASAGESLTHKFPDHPGIPGCVLRRTCRPFRPNVTSVDEPEGSATSVT
jgi:hypothetical protein